MKAVKIIVSGRVQGVGFRSFIYSKANELKLNGYVKNLNNTDVEIVISGDKDKINEMIDIIKKGSPWSHIDNIITDEINEQDFFGFEIRH